MRAPSVGAVAVALVTLLGVGGVAQEAPAPKKPPKAASAEPKSEAAKRAARKKDAETRRLFRTSDPLAITLAADFKAVNRDRSLQSVKAFPAVLTVQGDEAGGTPVPLRVNLRTRGHVRRQSGTCTSLPLLVEFVKQEAKHTVFDGQKKLKLVVHCDEGPRFDQLVLLEFLAYRLHNMMTPHAFHVRRANATYVDSKSGRTLSTHNAVFIEDDDDLAARMDGRAISTPGLTFKDFDQPSLALMAVFQYMIGNPDYSISGMHNVRVVTTASNVRHLIAWDYDVTGLVDPQYAVPNKNLKTAIAGARKRSYLGPCLTAEEFEPTLAAFRARQGDMRALINAIPGLQYSERSKAGEYLAEFFAVIESPERVKSELVDKCQNGPVT